MMRGLALVSRALAVVGALAATSAHAQSGLGQSAMGQLGTSKRLMDPSLPVAPAPQQGRQRVRSAPTGWFWKSVSPDKVAAHPSRWAKVVAFVEQEQARGRAVFGSQATARRILKNYGPALRGEAKRRNLSLPLLVAVIAVESNGNPRAKSHAGAGGLMQLMPGTARRFGVSNAYAPTQNIRGGAQYLDWLLRYFRGDAVLALAGYNAGEGAVDKHGGVPPYRETRDYVAKVAGAYAAARRLCTKPTAGPRDTCVLR